uniref:Transient receptor potential cation channel subfamily A member 1 n=1 Tax=Geotrypetes seraphini TaxID=260995 RepID=A0A6P8PUA4_GEOSA|nr:transient receptor potential cation channel subfamily A member 1 [Geotrypetes seraphini]
MKRSLKKFMRPVTEKREELYQEMILKQDACQKCPSTNIFELISLGDEMRLRSFILKNPNSLSSRNDEKATPLHYVAASGNLEFMQMIMDESSDEVLNVMNCEGNTPLHWAVEKNQLESVKVLLSRGANPNILNYYLKAPLHMAVQICHNEIVEVLASHSSTDINLEGEVGNNAVMMTCYQDNAEAIDILLRHGAKLCKRNKMGCYPIHLAAYCGATKCLEVILKKGEEIGNPIEDHINFTNNGKCSPLHLAVQNGSLEIVRKCIAFGAKIDLKQNDNATSLHFAATQGATEIVKLMVASYTSDKSIVNLQDGNNETPLHKSALFDHCELAEYLISMGADLNSIDNDSRSPLLLAVTCAAWKVVNLLLLKGANVKIRDQTGRNFLHLTVLQPGGLKHLNKEFLQLDEIKELVSQEDQDGCTPLHYACREGVPGSVNNLLGLNVSIYSKSKNRRSPLHFAASYGRINTCQRLLRDLTDTRLLNEGDDKGMTPLHMAAQNGHEKIVRLLLKKGALLLCDYKGWTALHYAAYRGYSRTMETLLETYVTMMDKGDQNGDTSLHIAALEGHAKVVGLLLDRGAAIIWNKVQASFLHNAIRNGKKEVVCCTIQNDRWDEAMQTFSHNSPYRCPLLEMIDHLPESFKFLLDKCMIESPGDKKSQEFCIEYSFKYLQCPLAFIKKGKEDLNVDYEPLIFLNAMVRNNRVELLSHPVCKQYLRMKWLAYGLKAHILNLAVYSLGLIPLTLLILNTVPPSYVNRTVNHENGCLQIKNTYFSRVCVSLLFIMSVFGILKEIVQIIQQRVKYLMDGTNIIDWTIYVSSLCFVLPLLIDPTNTINWQWQSGSLAVFLSWVNFLIYLQRFESYGIYIVMFWEILRTLLRIIILFFFIILAFGLSFYILLYHQVTFSNPYFSLMQTFAMMLGDINYQEGFLQPLINNEIQYPFMAFLHLILFTLLMPILLMNLLIGLAVGDIAEVQRNAVLKRMAMQVSLHTSLEKKLPYWCLKRVDQMFIRTYPNKPKLCGLMGFFQSIFLAEEITMDVQNSDKMELELWKQKNRLKYISTVLQKQHELLKLIIEKMKICSEAVDEDEHDLFQTRKPKK